MSVENEKHMSFNRIRDIIYNEDNELKHMKSIKKMVQKFEDDFGHSKLSVSLWKKYNVVYNIITNNKNSMIRIKDAITHFNENVREEGMLKMNGKVLGVLIMESNGEFYVSNWKNGKHLGKLKPEHIHSICEFTGVDANFLYGMYSMVQLKEEIKLALSECDNEDRKFVYNNIINKLNK